MVMATSRRAVGRSKIAPEHVDATRECFEKERVSGIEMRRKTASNQKRNKSKCASVGLGEAVAAGECSTRDAVHREIFAGINRIV
jgi:hypothetical protein